MADTLTTQLNLFIASSRKDILAARETLPGKAGQGTQAAATKRGKPVGQDAR